MSNQELNVIKPDKETKKIGPGQPPQKSFLPKKIHPDLEEEVGGRDGLEPTRYGDWEVAGKCTDF